MKRLRTAGTLIIVSLMTSAALAWVLRPAPIQVRTIEVSAGRFEQTIDEDGITRVSDRYIVSAPVAGHLSRTPLEVGDWIEAGRTLATLVAQPPAMLDWRTLAGLRERAAAASAAVRAAIATRDRARIALELARTEADRSRQLARDGFISEAALEASALKTEEHRQAVRAADMALESAEHEYAAAQAALLQGQPRQGAETQAPAALAITAPAAGRVLRVIQESEGFVTAGAPLFEIGNPERLEIVVDVLSQDAAQIRMGLPARVSFSLDPPLHPARVTGVEPIARTRVSALGVEEQRVRVSLAFVPPSGASIGDGWRVSASVITLQHDQATQVPNGALVRAGDAWRVFVVEEGRARIRSVTVRERNARQAWIDSGVTVGQTLILYPPASLRDGTRVSIAAPGNNPAG